MFDLLDLAFDPHEARDGRGRWARTPHLDVIPHNVRGTGVSKGTVDDPINCAGNVVLAAKLLSEGKHIRLNREAEVGTLLDRLAFLTTEAAKKGRKAPDIDLCRVSVPKTNLFCAKSKGIPRARMPQLSGTPVPGSRADALPRARGTEVDILPEFKKALAERGIKVTDEDMLADHLKATQDQLIGPKVAGIYEAMKSAQSNSGLFERIMVTRDGYVIDGHHRWAAQVALETQPGNPAPKMHVTMIDMEIGEALDFANAFANDWGIPQQGFVLTGPAVPPANTGPVNLSVDDLQYVIDLGVRHVRTPEGAKKYGQPIGSVIVRDPVKEAAKGLVDEAFAAWYALKPGDALTGDPTELSKQLDSAPYGVTVAVRQKGVGLQIWTKVKNTGSHEAHWESKSDGSTQIAYNGAQLVSTFGQLSIPPNFGGDIDKVLHPRDGDEITFTNPFNTPPEPEVLVYDVFEGHFRGKTLPSSSIYTPAQVISALDVSPDFLHGKATVDYRFWEVDADRLDAEFKAEVTKVLPHGWSQVTPREAFADDSKMAVAYYQRNRRATSLRLFKGRHGETVVVDDAGSAKYLYQLLDGVDEAMETVKDAPGIKGKHEYLTFTVGEEWEMAVQNALAYVRNMMPDDVQINPGLVNGTYDGGDPSIHAITPAVEPYQSMLHRLGNPENPGGVSWWGPASAEVTKNIFAATLTHELGHVNDGRLQDTGDGGVDANPAATSFWRQHMGLSQYAATNAAEGYAEAFAEWFFEQRLSADDRMKIPSKARKIAASYAVEYGWAPWDAQLMVKD